MKKIPENVVTVIACLLFICGLPKFLKAQQSIQNPFDGEFRYVQPLKGWTVLEEALRDYEIGIDTQVKHSGKSSASARSKASANAARAVALRQSVNAAQFHGKKVRLTGWLKGEKIEGWAGLWLRVDGERGDRLSMDNMQNRPVKGSSEWRQYELTLDVPDNAIAVSFGLVLAGNGQVWADDLRVESVSRDQATTELYGKSLPRPGEADYNRRKEAFAKRLFEELKTGPLLPVNLDFEAQDK